MEKETIQSPALEDSTMTQFMRRRSPEKARYKSNTPNGYQTQTPIFCKPEHRRRNQQNQIQQKVSSRLYPALPVTTLRQIPKSLGINGASVPAYVERSPNVLERLIASVSRQVHITKYEQLRGWTALLHQEPGSNRRPRCSLVVRGLTRNPAKS